MDGQTNAKTHMIRGFPTTINNGYWGLSHTLQSKKKERKLIQHDGKQMANRLMRLQQSENKTIKNLQKKYEQLQNIYKIRQRKEIEQNLKQKIKQQKQENLRLLKLKCKQEKQKNDTRKIQSRSNFLQGSRKSLTLQKNICYNGTSYKNQSEKKILLDRRKNKQIPQYRSTQIKLQGPQKFIGAASKNNQKLRYFNKMFKEEQQKKKNNIQRLKTMSQQHKSKMLDHQKKLNSSVEMDNLIKQSYSLDLQQLEKQIIAQKPNLRSSQTVRKVSSLSRNSSRSDSKYKRRSSQSQVLYNPEKVYLTNKQEQSLKGLKRVQVTPKQNIIDTIKAIEKIQLLQSTTLSSKQSKNSMRKTESQRVIIK